MRGTLILAFFLFAVGGGARHSRRPKCRVDLTRDLGVFPPVYRWFGYDESNYTTTKNGEALLHELHDLTPQPVYVRAHFLLTTGNGKPELKWSSSNVYSEDANGKPVYDWAILDGIFDAWVGAHVRPFVELGFMPKALSSHPDPYHIPWPTKPGDVEGWSFPPRDYAKWRELVRQVAAHMVARYGMAEVSTWYWEVWNEPDIFYWHGTEKEYDQLYDYAVAGVTGERFRGRASEAQRRRDLHRGARARCFSRRFCGIARRIGAQRPVGRFRWTLSRSTLRAVRILWTDMCRWGWARELQNAETGFEISSRL